MLVENTFEISLQSYSVALPLEGLKDTLGLDHLEDCLNRKDSVLLDAGQSVRPHH